LTSRNLHKFETQLQQKRSIAPMPSSTTPTLGIGARPVFHANADG